MQFASHQSQRGKVSTALFVLSTVKQQAVLRFCLRHKEILSKLVSHFFERQKSVWERKKQMALHLKLQSDLKALVRVLQGLKGHVREAVEPGKVHRYH